MSKWIYFEELCKSDSGKTTIFSVRAKDGDIALGEIKWFGKWRQYAFFPEPNTVFEKTCLNDIQSFLIELMQKRKEIRKSKGDKK